MLIRHFDFPVRPPMKTGESLAGYVSRFHGANGHCVPRALHEALRDLYLGNAEKTAQAFGVVQSVLGDIVLLDRQWWVDRSLIKSPEQQRAWPTLSYKTARYCPACLRERGFHLALWELPMMKACPVHECVLLTACAVCGRSLSWTDVLPHWTCRCDKQIVTMRAGKAKPGMVTIARLLACAVDVALPSGFHNPFADAKLGIYRLSDVYATLEWARGLRELLRQRQGTVGDSCRPRHQPLARRVHPGAWEAKLLADPLEVLTRRLARAIKRRFRTGDSMLACIWENDSLVQAMRLMSDPLDKCAFKEKIHIALKCFLAAYRLELPMGLLVLFNPKIGSEERATRLAHFAAWWMALSDRMAILDQNIRLACRVGHGELTVLGTRYQDVQVFEILEELFDAAHKRFDVEDFQAFSHWWRVPEDLRNPAPSSDVLNRIGSHLAKVSASEVAFVRDLVNAGYQWARK